MRESFHDDLAQISASVVELTTLVSVALEQATTALLEADLTLAEKVISGQTEITAAYVALEDKAVELLARQAPVAGDLRTIVAGLRGVADLERMGGLARHIAAIARMRYPQHAVPESLRDTIRQISAKALTITAKAAEAVQARDAHLAREMDADDDRVDALRRALFTTMLSESWSYGVEPAVDIALIGRYYERFADHAVELARLVVYMVTGERALADAPPPRQA
ncbi:MAG: phosphate signaling complex protein PhoU [Actinobacteria bacterium]|nr:phosphate signaling complex protein PhoU [Actinomycetota bacterium]MBI3688828.1 phosphate signaling complex protein PhoU [Actinomycetota bacterium]